MKIKVCGLRDPENIKAVEALAPNYMGFICYDKSPRFIGFMEDDELVSIGTNIIKVGVFVDEDADSICKLIYKYKFDAIQLHGNESPEFCDMYKHEVEVIKAFGIDEDFDFTKLDAYKNNVNYFLFDAKTAAYGGSGTTFDWGILDKYKLDVPFFLSGGLSLDNLEEVKNIKHPAFYGVDLNSRFEVSAGVKNINKLIQAFNKVKGEEKM
jgi:phosphoribosylanthranilate isomerase